MILMVQRTLRRAVVVVVAADGGGALEIPLEVVKAGVSRNPKAG
jgi:hypothetical protein